MMICLGARKIRMRRVEPARHFLRVIRHLVRQREQGDDLTRSMPSLADRTDHLLARQIERFPYLLNIAQVHLLAELPRFI